MPAGIKIRAADATESFLFRSIVHQSGCCAGSRPPDEAADPPGQVSMARAALVAGQVVGFCAFIANDGPGSAGVVDAVFVHESWRRQGVGRALIRDARQVAGRLGQASLTVTAQPSAESFFRGIGGHPLSSRSPAAWSPHFTQVFEFGTAVTAGA